MAGLDAAVHAADKEFGQVSPPAPCTLGGAENFGHSPEAASRLCSLKMLLSAVLFMCSSLNKSKISYTEA